MDSVFDREEAIEEILSDMEKRESVKQTFRAYMNQPEIISISSNDAIEASPPITPNLYNSYYNFTINLPRPALDVKSLQLLRAIIPQCNPSIPDYSLVFPYYKLRCLPINEEGTLLFVDQPSYNNLYYIRLLPSYYKPELLQATGQNFEEFGFNKTFNDYLELLHELKKSCVNDLQAPNSHFISEDVDFIFDEKLNRFIFRGRNTDTLNTYSAWSSLTTYQRNSVVEYAGDTYVCQVTSSINQIPPSNPSIWLNVSDFFEENPHYNAYIIAGYNDPNVSTLLQYIETISTDSDFNTATSIPGNRYVSGQTLARRLGFTWNGEGLLTTTINDYVANGITYGGTGALFYNRIRPFPYYDPSINFTLGYNPFTGSLDTYTADGYCNLVYTNIVSIYTTITGTSSVDTSRNANLLGMIDMNCGSLGIAMTNNFIDTKLTKIQPDIYTLGFELYDENSQPYLLTNNAVITLLLKLTY